MKMRELIEHASVAASTAAGIATMATPLGAPVLRRENKPPAKYKNSAPEAEPTKKKHASR